MEMVIAILSAAIVAGTPLLYATLGEVFTERAGILNLGVEGMMAIGAVAGFIATYFTNNLFVGVLVAALSGGLVAVIHAFLSISLRVSQVVSGLTLTIFGTGLSGFLGKNYVGTPLTTKFMSSGIPLLKDIPFIGPVFFTHDILVYLSYVLVPILYIYLYRTRFGLNLRSIGENPAAADALGVNVYFLRYMYVIFGGAMAGIGGAYLSLAISPSWLENMVGGRGWIAVALVIFASWDPLKALFGAYLFGGVEALVFRLQALGFDMVSPFFLSMLPYILTIIILVFTTIQTIKKHKSAPEQLGVAYNREER